MIDRAILEHPELIVNFDYFNDAENTIAWLRNQIGSPKAIAIADRLAEGFETFKANWRKQLATTKPKPVSERLRHLFPKTGDNE